MPAPLLTTPLALRVLTVAGLAALALTRRALRRQAEGRALAAQSPRDDALDAVAEGFEARSSEGVDVEQHEVAGRWRRVARLGPDGPGVEVDAVGIGRLRLRRVPSGEGR